MLSYDLTNLTNFTRMAFKNIYAVINEYLFIVKRYQKLDFLPTQSTHFSLQLFKMYMQLLVLVSK